MRGRNDVRIGWKLVGAFRTSGTICAAVGLVGPFVMRGIMHGLDEVSAVRRPQLLVDRAAKPSVAEPEKVAPFGKRDDDSLKSC